MNASSVITEVPLSSELFSWDVFSTKSRVTECVKRICLLCDDEVLAALQKFPAVDKLTETNGGHKMFRFLLCFDLLLYVHGKQLGSCRGSQLRNHTVTGQVFRRQFTSI